MSMTGIKFVVTADNRDFISRMESARGELSRTVAEAERGGGSVREVMGNIESALLRIASAATAAFTASKALEFARACVKVRSEVESIEQSMDVLLGSSEQARSLLASIREFAATTPMDMDVLAQGAQTMLGFNIEAGKVMPMLRSIGDISMGNAEKFGSLTLAFSQMSATGKLMGQDLLQMINAGFNPLAEISRKTGKSIGELKDEMEKGQVSADMVTEAFMSATAEGGKFHGMLEHQAEGLAGAFAYLRGAIGQMQNDLGDGLSGPVTDAVNLAGDLTKNYREVAEVIAVLAGMYGTYRAAVMVESAAAAASSAQASAVAQAAYLAETEALSELAAARGAASAGSDSAAIANGRLTASQASVVASLRQEALAYVESLELKAANTRAANIEAAAELQAAQARSAAAIEAEAVASREYAAAVKRGERSAILSARTAYEAAEEAKNTAVRDLNTASVNYQATAKAREAAATEASTARKRLDTAATVANAAAEREAARSAGVLALAKQRLSVMLDKVGSALSANPYGLALAAIVALTYGTYKLVTAQTEAEKAQRRLNEAFAKGESDAQSEGIQIRALFDRLKRAREGTDEWNSARDAIWSKYGSYLSRLGDEATALNDVAKAYGLVAEEAAKSARARAMDTAVQGEEDYYKKRYSDNYDKIYNYIAEKKGTDFADSYRAEISRVISGELNWTDSFLKQFDREVTAVRSTVPGSNAQPVVKYTANTLRDYTDKARQDQEELRKNIERIYSKWGSTGKKDSDNVTASKEPLLKEDYDKALKEYEDAKSLVARMNADRSGYTTKAYEKAVADLKKSKEALEKLGGDTKEQKGPTSAQLASKEENAEGKLADILRKQAAERLRIEQDYEFKRWQTRIDIMNDGEAKILAQQELNSKKELTELSRRKEQEVEAELQRQMAVFNAREDIKASTDKKYAKKVFRDSDIDQSEFDKIEKRYNDLESDLIKSHDKAEQERLQASRESMNAYLKEFGSYQEKRLAIHEGYEKRISEAQNEGERMMLTAQRNKALSDLDYDEWVDTGAIALAFGDISKLSDATVSKLISDMERYREKVIATFDPDKIQKYEAALSNLRNAQADGSFGAMSSVLPDYFKERRTTADRMDSAGKNVNALYEQRAEIYNCILSLKGKIADAENNGEDASALKSQLREAEVELAANSNAAKKAVDSFKLLHEQWDRLESPQEKFEALCVVVSNLSGLVGGLASQAAEMCDAMGAEGLGKALGTLSEAMDSVGNVASGFAQGGLVGGIAAAAGEVMKWTTKLFMAGDAKHQENIERLQEQIDAIGKSYEKVGKEADKAFSVDASRLIEQQNTLLEQQKALIRQQMAEEEAKKKTDDEKVKQYKEQLEEIDEIISENAERAKDAIFGEGIRSQIEQFAEAWAGAWERGESRAVTARETVRGIMQGMVKEAVKAAVEGSSAMESIRERLEGFFSDGVLSIGEQEEIYGMADRLQREIDARFGANSNLLSGERLTQSATGRSWESFSQETGDALTGRFTALCETGERIREVNTGIAESVGALVGMGHDKIALMEDALNVHIMNMGHLEAISKNTRELAAIREELQRIERRVRNL